MAKGQVEGMSIVCKLTRPEPQPFFLALTHGETIFLCLYHARTSDQATGDHHRASRNDSKQLILSCLPYLALLFPRNPSNGCGLNVLLSSLLPSASWPIRCLPLWPCVTYNEPLSRTWVYSHPLVSTEGWFQDPPRLPESKDVLYKMVLPICGFCIHGFNQKESGSIEVGWICRFRTGVSEVGLDNKFCFSTSISCFSHATSNLFLAILWTHSLNSFNNPLSIYPTGSASLLNLA